MKTIPLAILGKKIQVAEAYWFDGGEIPRGAIGTVVKCEVEPGQSEPTIHVKMDKEIPDLEDNIMSFYPQCGSQEIGDCRRGTTVEWFNYTCRIIH